jgi:hypothetical protein
MPQRPGLAYYRSSLLQSRVRASCALSAERAPLGDRGQHRRYGKLDRTLPKAAAACVSVLEVQKQNYCPLGLIEIHNRSMRVDSAPVFSVSELAISG